MTPISDTSSSKATPAGEEVRLGKDDRAMLRVFLALKVASILPPPKQSVPSPKPNWPLLGKEITEVVIGASYGVSTETKKLALDITHPNTVARALADLLPLRSYDHPEETSPPELSVATPSLESERESRERTTSEASSVALTTLSLPPSLLYPRSERLVVGSDARSFEEVVSGLCDRGRRKIVILTGIKKPLAMSRRIDLSDADGYVVFNPFRRIPLNYLRYIAKAANGILCKDPAKHEYTIFPISKDLKERGGVEDMRSIDLISGPFPESKSRSFEEISRVIHSLSKREVSVKIVNFDHAPSIATLKERHFEKGALLSRSN